MNSRIPHHNFFNPGVDGHTGDQSFYVQPEVSETSLGQAQVQPETAQAFSWQELNANDYLSHLSMAVDQLKVPVVADPEFEMVPPPKNEHAAQQDTSKTTAFVWKDGKPHEEQGYFDKLKDASQIKVPLRRTDLDNVKAFHRSPSGTISEMPIIQPEALASEVARPELPVQRPVHDYEVINLAEDLRKLGAHHDPRIIDGRSLAVEDALRAGEARDDDKRFEELYHAILENDLTDPSGERFNKNEIIHAIKQIRESIKENKLAQAELFFQNVPVTDGLRDKVRKLTRIHELQVEHARRSVSDAYSKDNS